MHHFLLGKGKRPGKDEINLPDKRELEKKHTDTHTHTHGHIYTVVSSFYMPPLF